MHLPPRLFVLILVLLSAGGCNLYEWTYTTEDSTDFAVIMSGAEQAFDTRDYDQAIILYDRATQVRPGDAWPQHRKLQSLLLRNTSEGTSLFHAHAPLFDPGPWPLTNTLYGDWKALARVRLLEDMTSGVAILNRNRTNTGLYWSRLSPLDPSVLGDSALGYAVYGLLILQDGNSNAIPLEDHDPGRIDCTFAYSLTNTLSPTEATNLSLRLAAATNALRQAGSCLSELFAVHPSSGQPGTLWSALYTNLLRARDSAALTITTLGVLP